MTSRRLDPTLRIIRKLIVSAALAGVLAAAPLGALADGTETLGPPSVPIAAGTDVIVAGVGLATGQPGTINLNVPAGATVKQVLLYFSGFFKQASDSPAAMTVQVGGNNVQAARIGGPTFFFTGNYPATYRADITGLGLISPGANSVQVGGLAFTSVNHGAGLLVIFDDGSPAANIQVRDGTDTAFINFPDPRKETVAQTYNFAAATAPRTAAISIFTGSIKGQDLVSPLRPTTVEVTVNGGGPTIFFNQLGSNDGEEWDTLTVDVDVPAAATSLTVQVFSKDVTASGELPASLVWVASAMSLPPPQPPKCCCEEGKPQVLTMQYTGQGPDASNHAQAAGKAIVAGDPKLAGPVRIVAAGNDISNPKKLKKAKIFFDGQVALNGTFDIDATKAGMDKLKANTYVFVYGTTGELLQSIKFHTSCSQPLNIGDQFGSLLLQVCQTVAKKK